MNTRDEREHPLGDAAWQAQERARLAARDGHGDADAVDLRIARALREPPPVALPADFAARVARLARAQAAVSVELERRLLRGLVLVFGLSAATAVGWLGRGWVDALAAALPGGLQSVGWLLLALACLLGDWAWGVAHARMQEPRRRPA